LLLIQPSAYANEALDLTYDARRCIHAQVRGTACPPSRQQKKKKEPKNPPPLVRGSLPIGSAAMPSPVVDAALASLFIHPSGMGGAPEAALHKMVILPTPGGSALLRVLISYGRP